MLLLRTKVVFKFAVSLCFYLSFILFLKVVMTAANITKRLVKEKTIDWVNTTFPSKLMGWIVMTIKLVLRNCSDNLRFKPYLFSFLFLHFVGGWHKFWSQACQCLRFLSAFRDFRTRQEMWKLYIDRPPKYAQFKTVFLPTHASLRLGEYKLWLLPLHEETEKKVDSLSDSVKFVPISYLSQHLNKFFWLFDTAFTLG